MQIAVYGLGYVGLVSAACLAKQGHGIVGVDVAQEKVDLVNRGLTPIAEPGLGELLLKAHHSGQLKATHALGEGLNECNMAIVCVGTPSSADGSHNMSYIAEVSRQIATAIGLGRRQPITVVYRSTMRPGTMTDFIRPIFANILGGHLAGTELVYNPEFLRESVAISDFFNPPKIVIGTHDGKTSPSMQEINRNITAPTFYTGYREAEFTKFMDNSFHALKVAFANEIGRVCMPLGVDVAKVHEIFVADTKLNISAKYLRPGGAFGGSCLPKDVRALQHMAKQSGAGAGIIDALLTSNEAHKAFLYDHCVKGLAKGARVLQVGLAFKADSDDLRESPNLDLARRLVSNGFDLRIFDETLEPAKLHGQNLGFGYSHLPNFADMLVSKEVAQASFYDLVIDTNSRAEQLNLKSDKIVSLYALA